MIDVDAIVDAIAKQMSRPPALPQKAQKAFGRICVLLGRDVPNVRVQDVTNDDDEDDDDDDGSDSEEEAPKRKSKKRASTDGGKPKSSKKQKKRA
jgi:DNA polymerase phi